MIKYFGTIPKIQKGVALANIFFNHPTALREVILSRSKYEFSTASPEKLVDLMQQFWSAYTVVIYSYSPKNWLGFPKKSNVLAYTTNSKSLFINANNLNRSDSSVAGTIIHELTHCADNASPRESFGHGDNSSHGKDTTFPYAFGRLGKEWLERR